MWEILGSSAPPCFLLLSSLGGIAMAVNDLAVISLASQVGWMSRSQRSNGGAVYFAYRARIPRIRDFWNQNTRKISSSIIL